MIAGRMKPQVIYNPFAIANYHNQNTIIHLLKPYFLPVMLTVKVSLFLASKGFARKPLYPLCPCPV
jgi:hypothetical protein